MAPWQTRSVMAAAIVVFIVLQVLPALSFAVIEASGSQPKPCGCRWAQAIVILIYHAEIAGFSRVRQSPRDSRSPLGCADRGGATGRLGRVGGRSC